MFHSRFYTRGIQHSVFSNRSLFYNKLETRYWFSDSCFLLQSLFIVGGNCSILSLGVWAKWLAENRLPPLSQPIRSCCCFKSMCIFLILILSSRIYLFDILRDQRISGQATLRKALVIFPWMEFSVGLNFRLMAFHFSVCVFPMGKVVGRCWISNNLASDARNTESWSYAWPLCMLTSRNPVDIEIAWW